MKKALMFLCIFIFSLLLGGCFENEKGTLGPSWDTTFDIPIINVTTESAINLFEDTEEFFIPDSSTTDSRIRITKDFSELDTLETGGDLTDIDLPNDTSTKYLDPLEVNEIGTINLDPIIITSTSIETGPTVTGPTSINVTGVSSTTFSKLDTPTMNKLLINIENNLEEGTLEDVRLKFDYYDSKNISQTSTTPSILINQNSDKNLVIKWNLANKEIDFSKEFDVTVLLTKSNFKGNIEISFGFSTVEITKVTGLDSNRIATSTFKPENVSIGEIENGVQSIKFKNGYIFLDITAEGNSGLVFNLTKFKINNLEDLNLDNRISFDGEKEDEELDLASNSGINVEIEVSVTTDSGIKSITYDSTKPITIKSGFSENTTISYLTLDDTFADFSDSFIDINEEIIEEVPDVINDLSLSTDAAISFSLNNIPEGLEIDMSKVKFLAIDEDGTELSALYLNEIGDSYGILTHNSPELNFLGEGKNLLTWLQDIDNDGSISLKDVDKVLLIGRVNVKTNETVIVSSSDTIIPSINIDVPLDIALHNDYSENFDPISFSGIDQDEADLFKKGEFIIEELINDFPITVSLKIYIGEMIEWDELNDEELENLEDEELDRLNIEENLFKTIEITKKTTEKKIVTITEDDINKLVGDNLFLGIVVTIPSNAGITVSSNDEIKLEHVHAKLTLKINQDE